MPGFILSKKRRNNMKVILVLDINEDEISDSLGYNDFEFDEEDVPPQEQMYHSDLEFKSQIIDHMNDLFSGDAEILDYVFYEGNGEPIRHFAANYWTSFINNYKMRLGGIITDEKREMMIENLRTYLKKIGKSGDLYNLVFDVFMSALRDAKDVDHLFQLIIKHKSFNLGLSILFADITCEIFTQKGKKEARFVEKKKQTTLSQY
jgi:hypothetical protein